MRNTKDRKNFRDVLPDLRKKTAAYIDRFPVIFSLQVALVITLLVEILARRSVLGGIAFMFLSPVKFILNWAIIFGTLMIAHLFKRRDFWMLFTSLVWLALGVTNFIILSYRTTPLGVIDIALLKSSIGIINVYFDWWHLALLAASAAALISALAVLHKRLPKVQVKYIKSTLVLGLTLCMVFLCSTQADARGRSRDIGNIADVYDELGFAYCFSTGAVDRGIEHPEGYSQSAVESIIKYLPKEDNGPEVKPNIIFLQLESFFDVKYLDDTEFTYDPVKNFTALREKYPSGFLTVPSVGAGTANTEFEILSGMSLDYFGMGEYPYKTILQERACESICADLRGQGYTSHAFHNNTGTFYDRHEVFSRLGFDTFTSIEFMEDVEYNPIGWAKDECLIPGIEKALQSSDGPEFIFAISVQGHGKYQRGAEEDTEEIKADYFQDEEAAFEYYVSQLEEVDEFIGELVSVLEACDEPTVLVMYGDHLPNFDIGASLLENGDIFETEYLIWNNIGIVAEDKDISAYQLSSRVLELIGMPGGVVSTFHRTCAGLPDYDSMLRMIEYDLLYGETYCYYGVPPYFSTDLQMGIEPVVITDSTYKNGVLTVTGKGFTPWSVLLVNGEEVSAELTGEGTLQAEIPEPVLGQKLQVVQKSRDFVELACSPVDIYRGR